MKEIFNCDNGITNQATVTTFEPRPCLWVSEPIAARCLSECFYVANHVSDVKPGEHFIALKNELEIRKLAQKLISVGAEIKVYQLESAIENLLAGVGISAAPMFMLGALPYRDWLKSRKEVPLDLEDAVAIAEHTIKSEPDSPERMIALDILGRRAGMNDYRWHKDYLNGIRAKLEEALALPDGKIAGSPSSGELTLEQVTEKIDELIALGATGSYLTGQLNRLAAVSQYYIGELRKFYYERLGEADLEESRTERKAEVENLLKIGKSQLELQDYLDSAVACPLERVAGWMGTTPVAMLTTLYPVIGSLLEVGTRLELIKATDHYALPVIYAGLVCESGGGKTPAQKTVLKPLFALQAEAEIEYKERLSQYQQELSEWKKVKDNDQPAPEQPVPHEYYTTDATSEAIALIQSQQPNRGFLGWFDELPALFKSQGQYKSGRGADGEKILSGRDGTGFKVNRASGKRLVVDQSAYSITGSLQPLILRQMMGDFTDANGQWARFLWTVMQVQPAPYPDDAIPFDVTGLLKGIYKRLKNLPATTYTLSPPAKKVYRRWYNELDQLKMSESRQGMRAVFAKMKGDTGVLALLLHCFNGCVHEGSTPDSEIDEQTMVAAIKLAKHHIGQVKLIHSEGDAANGEIAAIHTKIIQLSERKGWLKAADMRDIDRQIKKQFTADDIRRHFRELEASGFGQTRGEGTKLMWSIYQDNDSPPVYKLRTNSGQTQDNPPNTTSASSLCVQSFVVNYSGQTQGNSGQTQDTLKSTGSASSLCVQQSSVETQDTQDSFAVAQRNLVDVHTTGNEIKDAAPNFDVLSCPEFVSESRNSTTVCIPAQDKTQDNCPGTVLSCPELLESEEAIADLAEILEFCSSKEMLAELRSTNGFTPSVMSKASKRLSADKHNQIKEWVLQLNNQDQQQQPHKTEGKVGKRIRYSGEYSGELSAISKNGEFFVTWDVSSQRQAQRRNRELPLVLKAGDFEVTP
ncbi:DUF3987 domain-containing protein [Microcoleus sp. FACHB-53]|nr:DUF3987 domain-containing protein [Microcoleus sp. FACHB-53]